MRDYMSKNEDKEYAIEVFFIKQQIKELKEKVSKYDGELNKAQLKELMGLIEEIIKKYNRLNSIEDGPEYGEEIAIWEDHRLEVEEKTKEIDEKNQISKRGMIDAESWNEFRKEEEYNDSKKIDEEEKE